ncbi:MAG: hypothetical protein E6G22_12605 [Actinobacteria bacterium]|nr:MAG: hypothetical protein E6G22_12605 [Actinomycetota bacterium]
MSSAPATPAASAICFGRLWRPEKPPPTKPRRVLVCSRASKPSKIAFAPASTWPGSSLLRVAREAHGVEERADGAVPLARRAHVDRQVGSRELGHVAAEVRKPPGDRDAEPRRRRIEAPVEGGEAPLELRLRGPQVGSRPHPRRHDAVVERRHEHLDAFVRDRLHPSEQVLLPRAAHHNRALGRRGEPVDELVDPARADGAGRRPGEEATSREPHDEGRTRTSERSMRSRSATTLR